MFTSMSFSIRLPLVGSSRQVCHVAWGLIYTSLYIELLKSVSLKTFPIQNETVKPHTLSIFSFFPTKCLLFRPFNQELFLLAS